MSTGTNPAVVRGAGTSPGAHAAFLRHKDYTEAAGDLTIKVSNAELCKVSFKLSDNTKHIVANVALPWPLKGVSRLGDALVAVNHKPTTAEKSYTKILQYLNERRNRRAYELTFRLPQVQMGEAAPVSSHTKGTPGANQVEGFLKKLSRPGMLRGPRWQDGRFFVLNPDRMLLQRFKNRPTMPSKDKSVDIDLRQVTQVSEAVSQPATAASDRPVRFAITLRNGEDRMFEAPCTEDARVWVAALASILRMTAMTEEPITYLLPSTSPAPAAIVSTPVPVAPAPAPTPSPSPAPAPAPTHALTPAGRAAAEARKHTPPPTKRPSPKPAVPKHTVKRSPEAVRPPSTLVDVDAPHTGLSAYEESQRKVQEILGRQKENATDEFDIVYERLQVLMMPPKEGAPSRSRRPVDAPRLGLSLSDTPDGRIFVAAVLPTHQESVKSRERGRSRSRRRMRRHGSSSSTTRHNSRSVSPSGSVGGASVYSCTSYEELRHLTRRMKAVASSRSPTRANVRPQSPELEDPTASNFTSLEEELLVFDEANLPLVTAEGLDPETLEPVTAATDGQGLQPGDVIMALDNLAVKRTDTLATVAQRLLRRTMSRGTWVTVARPIGRIAKRRTMEAVAYPPKAAPAPPAPVSAAPPAAAATRSAYAQLEPPTVPSLAALEPISAVIRPKAHASAPAPAPHNVDASYEAKVKEGDDTPTATSPRRAPPRAEFSVGGGPVKAGAAAGSDRAKLARVSVGHDDAAWFKRDGEVVETKADDPSFVMLGVDEVSFDARDDALAGLP